MLFCIVMFFCFLICCVLFFFFFKQKTAYEVRISDWSSDVCSSDLTNAEVRDLNQAARDRLRDAGELGQDVRISAERGARDFASGDRIMFLKNERGMGVKNGTLGKVERVSPDSMAVRLDDGRQVAFDLKDYAHVDHGYAATIHK